MKQMWNVPLQIVGIIKGILLKKGGKETLSLNYKEWKEDLKHVKLNEHDVWASNLLDKAFTLLGDANIDFHILKLEGLWEVTEENMYLTLEGKIKNITGQVDMDKYRTLYKTNLNKKKDLLLSCIDFTSDMQWDKFLVLKYGKDVTYLNLWNEFYVETRGLIIDLEDLEIVSAPYRKFYNLNETAETKLERVISLIENAEEVTYTNKEDGSMISLSKYKGELFVSTPGAIESKQAKWALQYLKDNHTVAVKIIPEHLTFIFEAIYPENRVVVNYGDKEDLILTGIRDKNTGYLLKRAEVEELAQLYGFHYVKKESKTLIELLEESRDTSLHPATDKEGWVVRIDSGDNYQLLKIKCEDYCEIHKIVSAVNNPKLILKHLKEETFDDFLSKVPDNFREVVLEMKDLILNYKEQKEKEILEAFNSIPKEVLFLKEELDNYSLFQEELIDTILPQIDKKLSKNKSEEIKQAFIKKASGKDVILDKWTQQEMDRLWNLVPEGLKNQTSYFRKSGRLAGFVNSKISNEYRGYVMSLAKFEGLDVLSDIKSNEIDFRPILSKVSNLEE